MASVEHNIAAFSESFRKRRIALGWSEDDLAEQSGLSPSFIVGIEARDLSALEMLDFRLLLRLARLLQTDIGTLFAGSGQE